MSKFISGIIMAFDFGTKQIGVAIGQNFTYTTQPLLVLKSHLGVPNWKIIECIYNEWKPVILIVGLPLQMNGNDQLITILSKKFAMQLKKRFNTKVEMHDERFSTIEARSYYFKYYYQTKNKNYQINSIAASIILNSWLNQYRN